MHVFPTSHRHQIEDSSALAGFLTKQILSSAARRKEVGDARPLAVITCEAALAQRPVNEEK